MATSIKSFDLNAKTYRRAATVARVVDGYIDELANFNGGVWAGQRINGADIRARPLELAIPAGSGTATQQAALQSSVQYGQSVGVTVTIINF